MEPGPSTLTPEAGASLASRRFLVRIGPAVVLTCLCLTVVAAHGADADVVQCQVRDGVTLGLRKRVDTPEMCWPSAWNDGGRRGRAWLQARELGGMQLRKYILENPGDYVSCQVAIKEGESWVIDETTRLVLFCAGERFESLELLSTESQLEMHVFTNRTAPIVLEPDKSDYFRSNDGMFLIVARFPEGCFGAKGHDLPKPARLGVEEGGELVTAGRIASPGSSEVRSAGK